MVELTPINVSALMGTLGCLQPLIYTPAHDSKGRRMPKWEDVWFSNDDKEVAKQIAWLLSGLPDDELQANAHDELSQAREHDSLAWTLCLRTSYLLNGIHDESHHSL